MTKFALAMSILGFTFALMNLIMALWTHGDWVGSLASAGGWLVACIGWNKLQKIDEGDDEE